MDVVHKKNFLWVTYKLVGYPQAIENNFSLLLHTIKMLRFVMWVPS
jgi:hypothetical protein